MSICLNCIACGKELQNVEETATNQPYEGLAFISYGHYGGTVFDPMDGRYLEISVCDQCLLKEAKKQNILLGQDRKPVTIPGPKALGYMPTIIGMTPIHRELVPWNPEVEDETEAFHLDSFEDYLEYCDKIETRFTDVEIEEMFEERR